MLVVGGGGVWASMMRWDSESERLADLCDFFCEYIGVNTGFGGNADTRTSSLERLQSSSLQHHQCAVITDLGRDSSSFQGYSRETESFPREVAKGLIVIRCNSLLRGHSAIRLEIIEFLLEAVNQGFVPLIPRRGSISASGDLCPLSYVGGFLEGNPDIYVSRKGTDGRLEIFSADEALKLLNKPAIQLRAKEGLAILNGTSASTALAALVMYDSHNLAILTQVITAMATEALGGTKNNYDPFISQVRPHSGQTEAAINISRFLEGSKFCGGHEHSSVGLAQDGYALRTSPQWIGPQLEDLMSADRQIAVELNSTTDNPLIDVGTRRFHHGGNFQAASITSAMEKTRTALVMLGRLVLAQCNEVINPMLNKGLPPNLCFDDPSASFTMKGVDVNVTAYYSELAFLANSVASHVQTADIGNQPVNSLALISARYTAQAVELLSLMCAAALYEFCQALDIRALYADFFAAVRDRLQKTFHTTFDDTAIQHCSGEEFFESLWSVMKNSWNATNRLDLVDRCGVIATQSAHHILDTTEAFDFDQDLVTILPAVKKWKLDSARVLITTYEETRTRFLEHHTTEGYLGHTTKAVYHLIRNQLSIPLHLGVDDHPALKTENPAQHGKKTIGSHIGCIFQAICGGKVLEVLHEAL